MGEHGYVSKCARVSECATGHAVSERLADAEVREAVLCDLLNTWARETGVEQARRPAEAKAVADRLWGALSHEAATLRAALLLAQADAGLAAMLRAERDAAQARCRELEATLAAQVEATDRETTRLRGLLRDAYQTNHAERIELAALRDRVAALEAWAGKVCAAWDRFDAAVVHQQPGPQDHDTFSFRDSSAAWEAYHPLDGLIADYQLGAALAPPTPEPTGEAT